MDLLEGLSGLDLDLDLVSDLSRYSPAGRGYPYSTTVLLEMITQEECIMITSFC